MEDLSDGKPIKGIISYNEQTNEHIGYYFPAVGKTFRLSEMISVSEHI